MSKSHNSSPAIEKGEKWMDGLRSVKEEGRYLMMMMDGWKMDG
jgi:hypothetical protein